MKKIIFLSMFVSFQALAVNTVESVDLNKYLGKWYEVASIPQSFQKQCVANTTAEYSFAEDDLIQVLNTCETKDGTRTEADGRARVEDTNSNAKLKVTFVKIFDWVFAFGGNYWILDFAPDYSYALVGDPTTEYAWILTRSPRVELSTFVRAEQVLKANGYDTCKVLTSIQNGGPSARIPLCQVVK